MKIRSKRPTIKALALGGALAVGLAGATALQAQESDKQPRGMMMQNGMMGMMQQMNQMMANCNRMMQGMMQNRQPDQKKSPSTTPEKKG